MSANPSQTEQEQMKRQREAEQAQIRQRMARIEHKLLVLSGKGGVGKSTVAVNLAISLALVGKQVGLLDIDIHGPSIPKILSLEDARVNTNAQVLLPVQMTDNLKVMSIGFMLQDKDQAVIWRGPRKYHMIKQFLSDVEWGDLDFLIIDSPPGTGDEPLSIVQLLETFDGAIVVTTPQELALSDVRKGITFCRHLNVTVLGVIENMSGFVCPSCGQRTDIFKSSGEEKMARELQVPFLGRIPIDPKVVAACDSGRPYIQEYRDSETARSFMHSILPVMGLGMTTDTTDTSVAIPSAEQNTEHLADTLASQMK